MKHETIAAGVVSGALCLVFGFGAGLLLSRPERQRTREIVAAAEEKVALASAEQKRAAEAAEKLEGEITVTREKLAAEKNLTFDLKRRVVDYDRLKKAYADSQNKAKEPAPKPAPKRKRTERPPAPDSVFTDLSARVSFTGTQFVVTNLNRFDWRRVEMELNHGLIRKGYTLNVPRIGAGQTITVGAMQFTKGDGTRFDPFAIKPQKFRIWCKLSSGNRGACSYTWN